MPLKYCGSLRFSDSEIPPAKAQRRQVRRGRKNILANGFHHFSPTFAAFASLRETFRVSVAAVRRQGEPLFPSAVWENACTTMLESFRGLRKFSVVRNPPRRGFTRAKSPRRQVRKLLVFTFAPLRLCGRYSDSFGCGSAALGPSSPPSILCLSSRTWTRVQVRGENGNAVSIVRNGAGT